MSQLKHSDSAGGLLSSPLLGIIGGISYHSTIIYYHKINQGFAKLFGEERSAPLLLYSHDFGMIVEAQQTGHWQHVRQRVFESAKILKEGGCQTILIASNTIHKLAKGIEQNTGLAILHIADAVGLQLRNLGLKRIGMMGTKLTMEEPFYRDRLQNWGGIQLIIPDDKQRQFIHDVIFRELVCGKVGTHNQQQLMAWCETWIEKEELDAVLLACTELNLLMLEHRIGFPVIDSLEAHVASALEFFRQGAVSPVVPPNRLT